MKEALILFTRIPIPGKTKTRMMPYLTARECAQLHMCFLKDLAAEIKKLSKDLYIFYTPDGKEDTLLFIFGSNVNYKTQRGDSLGERMETAFSYVFNQGYDTCVLIGSDIPEMTAEYIEEAFLRLKRKEIVFGPTSDGGYCLIGMKSLYSEAFHNQNYGHGAVLDHTLAALSAQNIAADCLECLSDMDEPEDLNEFLERYRNDLFDYAAHTRRFLVRHQKVSIIIPVYNEEGQIDAMQKQLMEKAGDCEIIFADGGSTDNTVEKISKRFKVVNSPKGRANQMNAGARASSGDVLLFLHCDSKLPLDPVRQVRQVMKRYRVGGFGIAFCSRSVLMKICSIISNYRMSRRNIIFGDQGIFIKRSLFFQIGMFPAIPIMEDFQFSLNLRAIREPIGVTRNRIFTSDRRFPKGAISKLKLMLMMNLLRRMYRIGIEPGKIAKLYKDVR